MKRRRKKNNKPKPHLTNKVWLRRVIMDSVKYWAPVLKLHAYVDVIHVYIAEANDADIGDDSGANVDVDRTRRTANLRIKRSVIEDMKGEYPDVHKPEDVVEMTVLHELLHIAVRPMHCYVYSTIAPLRNRKSLEELYDPEEEIVVEHLTRVLHHMRKSSKKALASQKYRGKVVYLSKDPLE